MLTTHFDSNLLNSLPIQAYLYWKHLTDTFRNNVLPVPGGSDGRPGVRSMELGRDPWRWGALQCGLENSIDREELTSSPWGGKESDLRLSEFHFASTVIWASTLPSQLT